MKKKTSTDFAHGKKTSTELSLNRTAMEFVSTHQSSEFLPKSEDRTERNVRDLENEDRRDDRFAKANAGPVFAALSPNIQVTFCIGKAPLCCVIHALFRDTFLTRKHRRR